MSATARRIVGDLDAESDFAMEQARLRRSRGEPAPLQRDPGFALPPPVERSISAAATLLRAFAREGDRLWTPRTVDPARMVEAAGLPRPLLESGPLEALEPCARILAWAETPAVERLRDLHGAHTPERAAAALSLPLAELPWDIGPPPAPAAAAVNHRGFCLETAQQLGVVLPGARRISSIGDLERHLGEGGAHASRGERWVLKAPYSAAGRSRLRGGGEKLSPGSRRRAERLLELHGECLFEPWMERVGDFGCCALLTGADLRILPPHSLEVGAGGGFRGIRIRPGLLEREEEEALGGVVRGVAVRLRAAGYSGPFGVDCWRYRDLEGAVRFHPLGEINARMSFGLVAQALAERLASAGSMEKGAEVRLRLGRPGELGPPPEAPSRVIPLLLPSTDEPWSAWIESRAPA